jgi:hypothetical protein
MVDTEISPEADAITLKALAKRPADRYQSAVEMRADIDRALAGQAVARHRKHLGVHDPGHRAHGGVHLGVAGDVGGGRAGVAGPLARRDDAREVRGAQDDRRPARRGRTGLWRAGQHRL